MEDFKYILVNNESSDKISRKVYLKKTVNAPLKNNEKVGKIVYLLDDKKIKEIKIDESTVLTKLFERILKEQNEGNKLILSQETAGTEDSFLVDLAVAANITMILVENRESAYYTVLNNRLLQLEEKISG